MIDATGNPIDLDAWYATTSSNNGSGTTYIGKILGTTPTGRASFKPHAAWRTYGDRAPYKIKEDHRVISLYFNRLIKVGEDYAVQNI